MIGGGALDRHPTLKIVFTELGSDWIMRGLDYMDFVVTKEPRFAALAKGQLSMLPSEYWHRQGYVGASMMSQTEMGLRHRLGVDTVMFGTDFPHGEGTWGKTTRYIQALCTDGGVSEAEAARDPRRERGVALRPATRQAAGGGRACRSDRGRSTENAGAAVVRPALPRVPGPAAVRGMSAPDAQRLADEIRAGMTAGTVEGVLEAHLADPVSVHHDPPVPTDGPMPREAFAALLTGNPMAAIVPDGIRAYGEVTIDGDTVSFESCLEGTTTAGEYVRIANRTVLTVTDAGITKLVQRYEPETLEALSRLAR